MTLQDYTVQATNLLIIVLSLVCRQYTLRAADLWLDSPQILFTTELRCTPVPLDLGCEYLNTMFLDIKCAESLNLNERSFSSDIQ